ncbi:hypothetical protein HDV05_008356, partial [Chytridiales sp. JEL 0842]
TSSSLYNPIRSKSKKASKRPPSDSAPTKKSSSSTTLTPTPFLFASLPPSNTPPSIPLLAHGLDRVLFNPGVHYLQDPRSSYFNFSPYLQNIVQPNEFNYEALPPYIKPSDDDTLIEMAKTNKRKYVASTSTVTSLLAKMYHLVTLHRGVNHKPFSMFFENEPKQFTATSKKPISALLKFKDGVYALDQEKPEGVEETSTVLSELGKSMEKMLTLPPDQFKLYQKNSTKPPPASHPEAYNFALAEKFLLRSQLDCHDPRLPKQTFDLKTRATIAIRMDPLNYMSNRGYRLKKMKGVLESFEREHFDMLRASLLKYNLQARIGNMDGIFVCYHNTLNIFGFQYLPVEEMDETLYGSSVLGDAAFAICVKLLQKILETATAKVWGSDAKVTFKGSAKRQELTVYVETVPTHSSPETCAHPTITKYELRTKSNLFGPDLDSQPDTDTLHPDLLRNWKVDASLQELGSSNPEKVNEGLEIEYAKVRKQCVNLTSGGGGNSRFINQLRRECVFEDDDYVPVVDPNF